MKKQKLVKLSLDRETIHSLQLDTVTGGNACTTAGLGAAAAAAATTVIGPLGIDLRTRFVQCPGQK